MLPTPQTPNRLIRPPPHPRHRITHIHRPLQMNQPHPTLDPTTRLRIKLTAPPALHLQRPNNDVHIVVDIVALVPFGFEIMDEGDCDAEFEAGEEGECCVLVAESGVLFFEGDGVWCFDCGWGGVGEGEGEGEEGEEGSYVDHFCSWGLLLDGESVV